MRSGSLRPGACSTPEDTSTCRAPVRVPPRRRFRVSAPPPSSQGKGQSRPAISDQSKAAALPPGADRPPWAVSHRSEADRRPPHRCRSGQIASLGNADGLHHGQPVARPDLGHAGGRLVPVQLQHVQRHRPVRASSARCRRPRPARPWRCRAAPRWQGARRLGRQMARRLLEEDEPDIGRPAAAAAARPAPWSGRRS